MRYLVTGSQMRAIDQDTIQNIGIPSLVLMERAAECVARKAEQLCDQKTLQILAICGVGNNGADGVAAARMLYLHGFDVLVVVVGNEAHATKEFEVQKGIAEKLVSRLWTGNIFYMVRMSRKQETARSSTQSLVLGFPEMWKEPMPRC